MKNQSKKEILFYFDQPLMHGQVTTPSLVMRPGEALFDPNSLVLIEEARAFHKPILTSEFEVVFIGQNPTTIWRYDHLAIYERPGKPNKQQLLSFSDDNSRDDTGDSIVQTTFTDLYDGMYSKVAWRW
jgi:hypothetical protein